MKAENGFSVSGLKAAVPNKALMSDGNNSKYCLFVACKGIKHTVGSTVMC